jgi:hypothetical protein
LIPRFSSFQEFKFSSRKAFRLKAEKNFIDAQENRRNLNAKLLDIQIKLKNLRDQMDRISRTDSSYLKLFTSEHETLNEEKLLLNDYKLKEASERDLFFKLSASLRESQEKERTRAESLKYFQLALSLACTFLGLISALLFSFLRKAEIHEILDYEKHSYEKLINKLDGLEYNHQDLGKALREHMSRNVGKSEKAPEPLNFNELVKTQNNLIEQNYDCIKQLANVSESLLSVDQKLDQQRILITFCYAATALSSLIVIVNYFLKP